MGELYKLTFPNGKLYIGVSAHGARRRFLRHEANTKINGLYLPVCAAWRKHGAPTMKVLAVIEDSLLYETEIRAIASYGTFVPGGYNLTRERRTVKQTNATGELYANDHPANC